MARLALTLLGVCAESMDVPRRSQDDSSKEAIQALSKVNDAFVRALQNDTPPCISTTTSTTTTTTTPYVEDVVAVINLTAQEVLGKVKDMPELHGWAGREELHEKIVNDTVDALRKNISGYVFNALAYLPDDRSDRQCSPLPADNVVHVGRRNLNFFVFYANSSSNETAEKAWDNLNNKTDARDAVLNRVFAKSNEDLCESLRTELKKHDVNTTAFGGGVAAVKCGYEFVWYELGYTYFYAAYSSTKYKWEMKGGAYDSKCGQIFFFP